MRYRISEYGRVLATRERGSEIRLAMESALRSAPINEEIVLDFSGVDIISFSVADEIIGRIVADRDAGLLGECMVLVAEANDDVLDPIVRALRRRQLVGAQSGGVPGRTLYFPTHRQTSNTAARSKGDDHSAEPVGEDRDGHGQVPSNQCSPCRVVGIPATLVSND